MFVRSFRAKLLVLFLGALVLLQLATLTVVHLAGRSSLQKAMTEELRVGSRVLDRLLEARGRRLSDSVRVLAADFPFREAVASGDLPTIGSVLLNHGSRIDADAVFLISLDGQVEADTLDGRYAGRAFPIPALVEKARDAGEASAIVSLDGRPHQFVVVPVLAPQPIAWVCIGFEIDESVLGDLNRLTGLEVSLWSMAEGRSPSLISTLPSAAQRELLARATSHPRSAMLAGEKIALGDTPYESLERPLETADRSAINVLLQRSIEEAERPLRQLELRIFVLSSLVLLVAIVAAIFFARGVTRPLLSLAGAAQRIEKGDYSAPVTIAQDDEIGLLATSFDTMRAGIREREERILHQATHDALTGLPNRTFFLEHLTQAIAAAAPDGGQVGMLMMDIDRFKDINDTLGHRFGDDLLVEFGRRLRQATRESDTVARLGGDEFAVMFEVDDAMLASEVARRISGALEAPFTLAGVSIDVRASMGIALCPLHADDAGTLMKRADVAMYDAKRNHESVAFYEPGRDEHTLRRLSILSELRNAIATDQLELHYQPKIDFGSERAGHAEALVRWRHPVHGMMPPDEFITLAEQSGNIGLITKWVLQRAIRDCGVWRRSGLDLTVAVNLSALDLFDPELPAIVSDLLLEAGLEPAHLVLEITESAVMRDAARARKILGELKDRGISLSIDDYGTGYSSLAHLRRLPVDELKIDKSFVVNLGGGSAEDSVIVRSTIELGHNMGLRVIAEGVESEAAWRELKSLGCDMAQGYYVSRPLPSDQFVVWMRESRWGANLPAPC
ncbi:MAG: EAL domain-containing protein [Thermoanaerobaculia bacterium]|jgi:diguanylate cyclase (GGDEF)-like protein